MEFVNAGRTYILNFGFCTYARTGSGDDNIYNATFEINMNNYMPGILLFSFTQILDRSKCSKVFTGFLDRVFQCLVTGICGGIEDTCIV